MNGETSKRSGGFWLTKLSKKELAYAVICTMISTVAFSVAFVVPNQNDSLIDRFDALFSSHRNVCPIVFGFMGFLYSHYFSSNRNTISLNRIIVAFVFGVFTLVGHSYKVLDGNSLYSFGKLYAFISIVALAGYTLTYFVLLEYAYIFLDRVNENNSSETKPKDLSQKLCMIILIISWLPYIVYFFPGGLPYDTCQQLTQFYSSNGLSPHNHHPYFVSMIFGTCFNIAKLFTNNALAGIFLSVLLQTLLGSFALSWVISWLQRLSSYPWTGRAALVFFCLFPLVPVYIIMPSKDTLHAICLSVFIMQILLQSTSSYTDQKLDKLCCWPSILLVALLVSLTRNNGIFLVIPTLLMTALVCRKWQAGLTMASVFTCYLIWTSVLLPMWGVIPASIGEALSIPLQIAGRNLAYCPEDITSDEAEIVQQVFSLPLDSIADCYDPKIADGVKRYSLLKNKSDADEFIAVVVKLVIRNPVVAIDSLLCTVSGFWYPFSSCSYWVEDNPYIDYDENTTARIRGGWTDASSVPAWQIRTFLGQSLLRALPSIPGLNLLYAPGTYLWLLVLVFSYTQYRKVRLRNVLVVLMPLVMLELVFIASPCCSLRYTLPLIYSAPTIISLVSIKLQPTTASPS